MIRTPEVTKKSYCSIELSIIIIEPALDHLLQATIRQCMLDIPDL